MTRQDRIDAAISACTNCGGREFPKRPDCDGCTAAVDAEIAAERTALPTEQAWAFFMEHRENIRACCERFLPHRQWKSMVGPFGGPTNLTVEAFDEAVTKKDSSFLMEIMSEAWGRAPEDRRVYDIPGFRELCDLLDETVAGFVTPESGALVSDEDDVAF